MSDDGTEIRYVALKRRRGAYLAEIQEIHQNLNDFDPERDSLNILKSSRDALKSINRDYSIVYNDMLEHSEAVEAEILASRTIFRKAQAEALAKVEDMLEEILKQQSRKITTAQRNELEAIKIQFDEFENFVDESMAENAQVSDSEFLVRLPDLESLSSQYITIWNKMYPHESELKKKEMEQNRKEFLKNFYKTLAIFKSKVPAAQITSAQPQFNRSPTSEATIKLPKLELPVFNGDAKLWINFRDTFKSLVHNVKTLSGVVKFRYLKTAITDENSPISHLLESEDGYEDAWAAVLDRYEDPRGILRCHFNEMLVVEKMKSESADELLRVINAYTMSVSALERMHTEEELYSALIAHLVLERLDPRTLDLWETENNGKTPYWDDLQEFLKNRRKTLAATAPMMPKQAKITAKSSSKPTYVHTSTVGAEQAAMKAKKLEKRSNKRKCHMCGDDHFLFKCPMFANLTFNSRAAKVAQWKVCNGCFGPHNVSDCTSKHRCKICKQHHHTLLHPEQAAINARSVSHAETSTLQPTAQPFSMFSPSCNAATSNHSKFTLLQTAIVPVQDGNGEWHKLRAFFDSGSDSNFITKSAAEALQIPMNQTHIEANGLGGNKAAIIKQKVTANVGNDDEVFSMEFLVTPKLTNLSPAMTVARNQIKIPPNIPLADPTFDVPGKIDILIGNEFYGEILRDGKIKLESGPVMLNTLFGWIFTGNVPRSTGKCSPRTTNSISTTQCNLTTLADLKQSVEKFYVIEDYRNTKRFLTSDEINSQTHFEQTHRRLPSGRFVVEILYNKKLSKVKNNFKNAMCQFLANERRWTKNESMGARVHAFMSEYKNLGHMTVTDTSMEAIDEPAFYLPYHAVENPDSTTTKLRIVFNGSSPSPSGISINEAQCVGPQVQSDIFTLSLRFRTHKVVIKADIEKMYRQVEIAPHQRRFQRIIYRENPSEKLQVYELNTVTYGTAAASYLATRCIQELGFQSKKTFPEAAEALIDDVYVDDVITGAQNVKKAEKLASEIIQILAAAGMKLRKFTSNDKDFLKSIPADLHDSPSPDSSVKALGRLWCYDDDTLGFEQRLVRFENVSRRIILAEIASNFDPDGLLGPVTLNLKKFMKIIFSLQLPWDAKLPDKEASEWKEIASSMPEIAKIRIPRLIVIDDFADVQLHGFCDASEIGYGACVYARSSNSFGISMSRLICSKSRIAPKEYRSIARLELCGAVILANLIQQVAESLKLPISRKICWSDSAIALHWLKRCPSTLQVFVANRVSEIQELSSDLTWRHISGEINPADLLSRGLTPVEISTASLWWFGPRFLAAPESTWPTSIVHVDPDELVFNQELKREIHVASTDAKEFLNLIESSSRLFQAKWKFAHILRASHNLRAKTLNASRRIGQISVQDYLEAEYSMAGICQREYFSAEFQRCSDGLSVLARSQLKNLDPIWDPNLKLMRVGGRLNRAENCDEMQKHPIIIPNCHLARLIIRDAHEKHLHAGQNATHSFVRLRYWPIRCKQIVKQEIHKCVKCFRARPKLIEQMMGQLPPARVTPSSIFQHSGVDYCGPFEIKVSKLRTSRTMKAYIAVFVCLSTKAVHLEVVTDLNTTAFFSAFDKFVSRRGLPETMSSDNGLNFVGAANELQKLHEFLSKSTTQAEIRAYLAEQEIKWKFIPPRAPTHGGLWEAAVKSMKHHLTRVASTSLLTFEELERLIAKIEAIMNSRPLTAMSSDPSDLSALTAGHFLIGRPLIAKAEKDVSEQPISRLQRWDRVVHMQQHFWQRWSTEYLHLLQVRTKNFEKIIPVKVGQMVLIHVDNCPPMKWPLGRITSIFPGSDGITRIAKIRTATSNLERPVDKLALLPIEDND